MYILLILDENYIFILELSFHLQANHVRLSMKDENAPNKGGIEPTFFRYDFDNDDDVMIMIMTIIVRIAMILMMTLMIMVMMRMLQTKGGSSQPFSG